MGFDRILMTGGLTGWKTERFLGADGLIFGALVRKQTRNLLRVGVQRHLVRTRSRCDAYDLVTFSVALHGSVVDERVGSVCFLSAFRLGGNFAKPSRGIFAILHRSKHLEGLRAQIGLLVLNAILRILANEVQTFTYTFMFVYVDTSWWNMTKPTHRSEY